MKILFAKAHMLCHDINPLTKGPNHIDVIMGASTGDIVWFEAYSQKYVRVNKNVRHYEPDRPSRALIHRRTSSVQQQYRRFDGFQDLKTSFSPLIWTAA